MKVSRPNAKELTPQELQQLERLKVVIKNATADGKLSRKELDDIQAAMFADKKVSLEELQLYSKLIQEKLDSGELEMDYY
ncbi:MAG: hypothetical protein VKL59_02845 [Nostocaceae cyanobacterium]|nr:hypothetical protein [Nostocaceae cyanobacterium]